MNQPVEIDIRIRIHIFSVSSGKLDDIGLGFWDVHGEILKQIRIGEITL